MGGGAFVWKGSLKVCAELKGMELCVQTDMQIMLAFALRIISKTFNPGYRWHNRIEFCTHVLNC